MKHLISLFTALLCYSMLAQASDYDSTGISTSDWLTNLSHLGFSREGQPSTLSSVYLNDVPCDERISKIKLQVEANSTPNMPGFNTYRYYLDVSGFQDETIPYISAIFSLPGWETILDCPGGEFYNSPLNTGPTGETINELLFGVFPEVEFDSYVSLGIEGPVQEEACSGMSYVSTGPTETIASTFSYGLHVNTDDLDFAFYNLPTLCEGHTPDQDDRFFVMQLTSSAAPRVKLYWQITEEVSLGVVAMRDHRVGFEAIGEGEFLGFEFRPDGGPFSGAYTNTSGPICSCNDEEALNYFGESALESSLGCVYNVSGCSDVEACNYLVLSDSQTEVCDYESCAETVNASDNDEATWCNGPDCCLTGTIWDQELQGCRPVQPNCQSDIDFNGVVGIGDLLVLLPEYGSFCGDIPNGSWSCGLPFSYSGKQYGTAEFGDECWFTENLATTSFNNGVEIAPFSGDLGLPTFSDYGSEYSDGLLYSGHVVSDHNVCPSGWHVATDEDWIDLEVVHGMAESTALEESYRGYYIGNKMRVDLDSLGWEIVEPNIQFWSEYSSYNYSTNELGFSCKPGGYLDSKGMPYLKGLKGLWWTSTLHSEERAWCRAINAYLTRPSREDRSVYSHASIRCVMD